MVGWGLPLALVLLLLSCAVARTNLRNNDNSPNFVLLPCSQESFYISFDYPVRKERGTFTCVMLEECKSYVEEHCVVACYCCGQCACTTFIDNVSSRSRFRRSY